MTQILFDEGLCGSFCLEPFWWLSAATVQRLPVQKGFDPIAQWLSRATKKAQGKNCRVSLHQREFVSRRMAMNTQSFMYATIASDAIQSPLIPTERPTERPTELLQPISHIVLELMNFFKTSCSHLCTLS